MMSTKNQGHKVDEEASNPENKPNRYRKIPNKYLLSLAKRQGKGQFNTTGSFYTTTLLQPNITEKTVTTPTPAKPEYGVFQP